ncbi:MAG: Uma2 family endonuclease [Planctomycetes bacterium]|nr:Uma2 family endonuclease [Planctomycetota bacterium]
MSTAQEGLVLGPELAGALLTPEEFDAAEEADELYVYELINGVLVVAPPPSEEERGPNEWLAQHLLNYRDQHPGGKALDFTLPEHLVRVRGNRRRADRVIWAGLGRVPDVHGDLPAIVIEHVSEGRRNRKRDYETKRKEYLEAGISEYWVIDRFRRLMTVYRGPTNRPTELVVRDDEVYTTPLLPGFDLPVAKLFSVADMLRKAKRRGGDR